MSGCSWLHGADTLLSGDEPAHGLSRSPEVPGMQRLLKHGTVEGGRTLEEGSH